MRNTLNGVEYDDGEIFYFTEIIWILLKLEKFVTVLYIWKFILGTYFSLVR